MKIKSFVFINKDDKVIAIPFNTEIEGSYKEAHELFERSNIPHYMFLLTPNKKEET